MSSSIYDHDLPLRLTINMTPVGFMARVKRRPSFIQIIEEPSRHASKNIHVKSIKGDPVVKMRGGHWGRRVRPPHLNCRSSFYDVVRGLTRCDSLHETKMTHSHVLIFVLYFQRRLIRLLQRSRRAN